MLPRKVGKQSPHCVNWIQNEEVEIVDGKIGRTIENKLSRLCKYVFAKDYIRLCHATKSLSTFTKNEKNISYDFLKGTNTNYLDAKKILMLAFKLSNFGTWVKKPEELENFELDIDNILTINNAL